MAESINYGRRANPVEGLIKGKWMLYVGLIGQKISYSPWLRKSWGLCRCWCGCCSGRPQGCVFQAGSSWQLWRLTPVQLGANVSIGLQGSSGSKIGTTYSNKFGACIKNAFIKTQVLEFKPEPAIALTLVHLSEVSFHYESFKLGELFSPQLVTLNSGLRLLTGR